MQVAHAERRAQQVADKAIRVLKAPLASMANVVHRVQLLRASRVLKALSVTQVHAERRAQQQADKATRVLKVLLVQVAHVVHRVQQVADKATRVLRVP